MLEKLTGLLAEQLKIDVSTITPDTDLKEDLGVDSLDLFEFVMALEEEFDIEIPTDEVSELTTLQQVADYLEKATKLCSYEFTSCADDINTETQKYRSLTVGDISRVAGEIFKESNCTTLSYGK